MRYKRIRRCSGETRRQRHIEHATQMQNALKIITNNEELTQYYSRLVGRVMPTGGKSAQATIRQAIELTKQFAKQSNIPWGLP